MTRKSDKHTDLDSRKVPPLLPERTPPKSNPLLITTVVCIVIYNVIIILIYRILLAIIPQSIRS